MGRVGEKLGRIVTKIRTKSRTKKNMNLVGRLFKKNAK